MSLVELRRILNEVRTIPPEELEGLKIALLQSIVEELQGINEKLCDAFDIEEETDNEPK